MYAHLASFRSRHSVVIKRESSSFTWRWKTTRKRRKGEERKKNILRGRKREKRKTKEIREGNAEASLRGGLDLTSILSSSLSPTSSRGKCSITGRAQRVPSSGRTFSRLALCHLIILWLIVESFSFSTRNKKGIWKKNYFWVNERYGKIYMEIFRNGSDVRKKRKIRKEKKWKDTIINFTEIEYYEKNIQL